MNDVDVRLVQVTKAYGEALAVDHIDLEVLEGEFFSLLGPVRLRQDDDAADDRRVRAADVGPDRARRARTSRGCRRTSGSVNTVFQNYALFPHLTICENVAFGLRRTEGQGRGDQEPRHATCSSSSSCRASRSASRPRSRAARRSGSRSRGRSSTGRPVLLLDEPLGALDLKLRKQMQVELKRIQQEVGITFIYVTHDQEEAMTMSDRIAVMNKGRYEQLGDPETLYERPTTRFVAGFLGVSNLLRGRPATGRPTATRSSSSPTVRPSACRPRSSTGRTPGRRRRPPGEDPDPRGRDRARRAGSTRSRAS